jgi:hypothetical protein
MDQLETSAVSVLLEKTTKGELEWKVDVPGSRYKCTLGVLSVYLDTQDRFLGEVRDCFLGAAMSGDTYIMPIVTFTEHDVDKYTEFKAAVEEALAQRRNTLLKMLLSGGRLE